MLVYKQALYCSYKNPPTGCVMPEVTSVSLSMVFRNTGIAYLLRGGQRWAISAVTLDEQGGALYLN